MLLYNGNIDAGLKEVKKALELDPVSPQYNWTLGNRYYNVRKYDLAISQFQKTLILFPNNVGAKEWLGLSYLQKKMYNAGNRYFYPNFRMILEKKPLY